MLEESPLHRAVMNGDLEAVRAMVRERPGRVHNRNSLGWTVLHAAAYAGNAEMAELLLAAGADPQAVDGQGMRPADLAGRLHPGLPIVDLLGE